MARGSATMRRLLLLWLAVPAAGSPYPIVVQDWACHKRGYNSCRVAYHADTMGNHPCLWCQETNSCVPEYLRPLQCPLADMTDEPMPLSCEDLSPADCAGTDCRGVCVLPAGGGETPSRQLDWETAMCVSRSNVCREPGTGAKLKLVTNLYQVPCQYRTTCFNCLHHSVTPLAGEEVDYARGAGRRYLAAPDPELGDHVCAWNSHTQLCEDRDLTRSDDAGATAPGLVVRMWQCPHEPPHNAFPRD